MRNKEFITEEGRAFYRVYSSRDLFDGNLFPLPSNQKWSTILNVTGKNAERNAELKANKVFREFMRTLIVDLIADEAYFLFPIKGMGKMGVWNRKYYRKYSKLTGEHNYTMAIFFSKEIKAESNRRYYFRLTAWGRNMLLKKSINRFKYGSKRINQNSSVHYIP